MYVILGAENTRSSAKKNSTAQRHPCDGFQFRNRNREYKKLYYSERCSFIPSKIQLRGLPRRYQSHRSVLIFMRDKAITKLISPFNLKSLEDDF